MWTLFTLWLIGGIINIGILNGLNSETNISLETKLLKFIQSWYAFGIIISIILNETIDKKNNK